MVCLLKTFLHALYIIAAIFIVLWFLILMDCIRWILFNHVNLLFMMFYVDCYSNFNFLYVEFCTAWQVDFLHVYKINLV